MDTLGGISMCVNVDDAIKIREKINEALKEKGCDARIELKNLETAEKLQVIRGKREVYGFIANDLYILVVLKKDCFGNKVVARVIVELL